MPNTSATVDLERGLAALRFCRSDLAAARADADVAAARLDGVRAARADELGEKLADAIAFCERLAFIVEGDLQAE
jgi:hypothetical protein